MLEQFTLSLGGAGNFFAVAMVCFKQKSCLKKQKSSSNVDLSTLAIII